MDEPKLLFCDEATANIDLIADDKLHNLVLDMGADTTVMWMLTAYIFMLRHA